MFVSVRRCASDADRRSGRISNVQSADSTSSAADREDEVHSNVITVPAQDTSHHQIGQLSHPTLPHRSLVLHSSWVEAVSKRNTIFLTGSAPFFVCLFGFSVRCLSYSNTVTEKHYYFAYFTL